MSHLPGVAVGFRVLGVDLSLTGTGLADGERTWLLPSKGSATATLTERWMRLDALTDAVLARVRDTRADLVVLEGPSLGQARQGGQHDRAGLWWLVVDQLHTDGIPVAEVPPATLKKYATGKGNAGKSAIVDATARRFPHVDTGSGDDNRCDAHWLAAMGHDHLGLALLAMPALNRQALDAVRWPHLVAATAA